MLRISSWCLRVALAATLLSAVADRFGLWGPPGSTNVSWGDWAHFVQYCARVNSFLPSAMAAPLAWMAT
ncbi:MAG TPA: DoxX family protein, partial [Bryobacteraceae bacterium]